MRSKVKSKSTLGARARGNTGFDSVSALRLPQPTFSGSLSVPKALKNRRTTRDIGERKLPLQLLSNLLWSACGVNRKKGPFGLPGRTAASASNSQEVMVFVVMEGGVFFFDAFRHLLEPVSPGDYRSLTIGPGQTGHAMSAPVHLVYVADIDRLEDTRGYKEPGLLDPEIQKSYYNVDAGLIAGNVYLFAASHGLAAWFHNCDKEALSVRLRLNARQRVLFAHSVGYRKRR